MSAGRILFIFPKWPPLALWGHFKYKFPPLGLLTLAALTPDEFAVSFIDENVTPVDFGAEVDLVAISVITPLAPRAYEISDAFRARGKAVVLGGIHVSCCPDEAEQHADAVVAGEAEEVWPKLLRDWRDGRLKPRYTVGDLVDMDQPFAVPRRDLLAPRSYLIRSTIQMTRGCPHDCEYCSVTAFSGRRFRHRPLDSFVDEFCRLPDRFVFIVDDNILSNRVLAGELFDRLRGAGKWWGSQVTIAVGDDEAMLKKMALSGCKSLFIGFESLDQENLRQVGKKFVQASKNRERIRRIQDHGIGILGSFIVGLDHDREDAFPALYEFITRARLEAFLLSVPTPFPGTRMTRRLEEEGRVLSRDWARYDMSTVVFRPKYFSPEDLQERYNELNHALYSYSSIVRRSVNFKKNMIIFVPQNLGFRQAWKGLAAARSSTGGGWRAMQDKDFPVAVIPAYNEAQGIRSLVEQVRAVGAAVIVVDDGSSDNTADRLQGMEITLLRNPVNMGKGASLQRGFAAALRLGANAVITLDGDGQHQPADIPRLLAAAKARPGRIIIGARTGNRQAAPPLRRFANRFADFWISWAAGCRTIRDSQSGFRLYPAELLRQVQLRPDTRNTFVFESEILIIAAHLGWFTEAVEIETIYHRDGISNYRAWTDTWLIVRRVAGHLFRRGMYPAGLLRVLRLLPDPRAEGP